MASDQFEVIDYTFDNLKTIIDKYSPSDFDIEIEEFYGHISYFSSYFEQLENPPRTIVVERHYVDHDYMVDHAAYYSRCFRRYKRKCTRLHFFSNTFGQSEFIALVQNKEADSRQLIAFNDSYLGFIILKPLPETIFGRTCLKTYSFLDEDGAKRFYSVKRNYHVNLFGIPLVVRDTVAWQEQDSIVAACATSALWSAFQCSGKIFHHYIPSPVEITEYATQFALRESKVFPNKDGLTGDEMSQAIRRVGLEPLVLSPTRAEYMKAGIYAYLSAGIPIILCFHLHDYSIEKEEEQYYGSHAVAVTGYSLEIERPRLYGSLEFNSISSHVNQIYVHDDQVGPFAPMSISELPEEETTVLKSDYYHQRFTIEPYIMLVPLYEKIRIDFEDIYDIMIHLDGVLKFIFEKNNVPETFNSFDWEIYLTKIDILKKSLSKEVKGNDQIIEILFDSLPRFIWVARLISRDHDHSVFDILFDATDINQGSIHSKLIFYDEEILSFILKELKSNEFSHMLKMGTTCWRIFQSISKGEYIKVSI